jgi:hypothetical protein
MRFRAGSFPTLCLIHMGVKTEIRSALSGLHRSRPATVALGLSILSGGVALLATCLALWRNRWTGRSYSGPVSLSSVQS